MLPSIGPPATIRDVSKVGNACVQAPAGLSSRIPFQTSSPLAIRLPFVAKQASFASAGLFSPTLFPGFASMFLIQRSRTRNACGVGSDTGPAGRASVNQIS